MHIIVSSMIYGNYIEKEKLIVQEGTFRYIFLCSGRNNMVYFDNIQNVLDIEYYPKIVFYFIKAIL